MKEVENSYQIRVQEKLKMDHLKLNIQILCKHLLEDTSGYDFGSETPANLKEYINQEVLIEI